MKLASLWSRLPHKLRGLILISLGGGAAAVAPLFQDLDAFSFKGSFLRIAQRFTAGALCTLFAWLAQSPRRPK